MDIRIKPDLHNQRIFTQIKNLDSISKRGIRQAFYLSGKQLVSESRKMILDAPKTGRTYVIYKNGRKRKHIASAPDEAPANLTGNLRKSIDFQVHGSDELEFGANTVYSRALELGNPSGNLLARPYLRPSINKNERNIISNFEQQLLKELNK